MHNSLFLLGMPNAGELILILFVIVIFFGAKRIPEMFKGIGQGVREFKDATKQPETEQPQYRDQPGQPPYPPQYPPQGYPQQGYPQQPPQPGAPQQAGYPQQGGYPQPGQPGYQQPAPPAYNPNTPNQQPS